jgi:signal transduction histidine kinase
MTNVTKGPKQRTSQRRRHEISKREEGLDSRGATIDESRENVDSQQQTAAAVRAELEALMAALREANGHLIAANLRSQALAEQMNQLYEEARSAIQAKDEFFTLISHELRTPLTSITGWAQLLTLDSEPATITEAARSIASSAAVQAQLIDDLLDVSRIMTNKFAITKANIDLLDVVNESVSGMRPLAAAKDISLRINAQQSGIIDGDAARLRQVLTNLLSNAIKFTPAGGLIETRLLRDGSFAVIEVSDTGEGIPAKFLPYVFERRAQATERRFAGLGLGLAIVKHIVELHGGSVAATSEGEGKGSTFIIRLPCEP